MARHLYEEDAVRAFIGLFVFAGFGCALAQEAVPPQGAASAPAGAGANSENARLSQPVFGGAASVERLYDQAAQHRAFTGRPGGVCSVRLLEMPIPKGAGFTIRKARPQPTGDRMSVEPPAPPCPVSP